MNEKENNTNKASIAPGMDNHAELEQNVTNKELEKGEFTEVTKLTDQITPS